jgi:hypothetical protein
MQSIPREFFNRLSSLGAAEIVKGCQHRREIPPASHVKPYLWAFLTVSLLI